MVNPKQKGNHFELLIYKDLRGLAECKRTIGSGSSDEPGDIKVVTNSGVLFAIECKHLRKVTWAELSRIWKKLKSNIDAQGYKDLPVVVFRQNREPIMAMFVTNVSGKDVRVITLYDFWKQIFIG